MKHSIVILVMAVILTILTGCDGRVTDQCKRQTIYKECMETVPEGVNTSDWEAIDVRRVMDKCMSFAYAASQRKRESISKGCM